jgi:cobalamin biosynthesis protein CobT
MDIFGGDEEGGDEEAAEDDAAEEEGGEDEGEEGEGGDEGADEEEGEEEGGDEESEPAIPEPDLSALPPEERAELTKAVDDELNSLFMDFEANALHSIAVQEESMGDLAQESYVVRLKRYLFEGETEAAAPKIDVHQFAADTARLVNNYQDLLDMEQLVFNKAKVFLMAKYDEASVEEFEEIMDTEHGISFGETTHPEPFDDAGKPETPWPPRAVGAQPPAA